MDAGFEDFAGPSAAIAPSVLVFCGICSTRLVCSYTLSVFCGSRRPALSGEIGAELLAVCGYCVGIGNRYITCYQAHSPPKPNEIGSHHMQHLSEQDGCWIALRERNDGHYPVVGQHVRGAGGCCFAPARDDLPHVGVPRSASTGPREFGRGSRAQAHGDVHRCSGAGAAPTSGGPANAILQGVGVQARFWEQGIGGQAGDCGESADWPHIVRGTNIGSARGASPSQTGAGPSEGFQEGRSGHLGSWPGRRATAFGASPQASPDPQNAFSVSTDAGESIGASEQWDGVSHPTFGKEGSTLVKVLGQPKVSQGCEEGSTHSSSEEDSRRHHRSASLCFSREEGQVCGRNRKSQIRQEQASLINSTLERGVLPGREEQGQGQGREGEEGQVQADLSEGQAEEWASVTDACFTECASSSPSALSYASSDGGNSDPFSIDGLVEDDTSDDETAVLDGVSDVDIRQWGERVAAVCSTCTLLSQLGQQLVGVVRASPTLLPLPFSPVFALDAARSLDPKTTVADVEAKCSCLLSLVLIVNYNYSNRGLSERCLRYFGPPTVAQSASLARLLLASHLLLTCNSDALKT
jgi:hypothetical protein